MRVNIFHVETNDAQDIGTRWTLEADVDSDFGYFRAVGEWDASEEGTDDEWTVDLDGDNEPDESIAPAVIEIMQSALQRIWNGEQLARKQAIEEITQSWGFRRAGEGV